MTLEQLKFIEERLMCHLRESVQSSMPRHNWDVAKRPDLLADMKDEYGIYRWPDARAIVFIRAEMQELKKEI